MRGSTTRLAGAFAAAGLILTATPLGAAPTNVERARMAARYVVDHQEADGSVPTFSTIGSTADTVVSLVAAKRGPGAIDRAIGFLEDHEADVDGVGEKAKVIMALVAAGRNPRNFAGRDLVSELQSVKEDDGRLGAGTAVFDQALGVLALAAAGEPRKRPAAWLAAAQCPDGGWQYDAPQQPDEDKHCFSGDPMADWFRSEVDATALAVQALETTFVREDLVRSPFRFFRAVRDEAKGGWGYSPDFPLTNANSTSLVIQAYAARGRDLPDGVLRALRALQHRLCGPNAGAFAYSWNEESGSYDKQDPNLGATVGAILGLLERPLPLSPRDVTKAPPKAPACPT
ncbi:MAG: hypothetical protein M3198_14085 [Actinomycetota bacterium]|nr:hypothetical protein [Actinomycetota bacterium]